MIEIRYQPPAESPTILADATQIHQLVMNLVTNAAHAIGQRKGVIELRVDDVEVTADMAALSPDLRTGHYARLSVCDDGSGMDKATLDRIFDPFFTTKPVGMGTGLGLSTVHGIIKAHEGAISVYSALGKGTIFHVYLPVAEQTALAAPVQQTQAPAGNGERILYVDDEPALVHLATRMLGRLGYQVETHTDPAEALGAFRQRPEHYDAVVTDLSMPRMSGFELARAMLEIRPGIPVVMTSGYLREEDHEHAAALGIRDVILKPSTAEDLSHVLHRLLGQLRPQRG
jgi:CheY-like chemotaxis protein